MIYTTQYRYHLSIGPHNPGLSPPPPPTPLPTAAAGEHYLEVHVTYVHWLARRGLVVPTRSLKTTLLALRREFFTLGPTSFHSVLAGMGAAEVPESFVGSLGPEMLRMSRAVAESPELAAARLLTLHLYVVAETMPLALAVEAEVARRAKAFADALEEVIDMAGDHDDQCPICLKEFGTTLDDHNDDDNDLDDDEKKIVRTSCCHVYHKACIARWLRISRSCPLCRYAMPIPYHPPYIN